MFNLFNRENYDPDAYNTNLASANFGNPGRSANEPYLPRQLQFGIMLRCELRGGFLAGQEIRGGE